MHVCVDTWKRRQMASGVREKHDRGVTGVPQRCAFPCQLCLVSGILLGLSRLYSAIVCYPLVNRAKNHLLFRIPSALDVDVWDALSRV